MTRFTLYGLCSSSHLFSFKSLGAWRLAFKTTLDFFTFFTFIFTEARKAMHDMHSLGGYLADSGHDLPSPASHFVPTPFCFHFFAFCRGSFWLFHEFYTIYGLTLPLIYLASPFLPVVPVSVCLVLGTSDPVSIEGGKKG